MEPLPMPHISKKSWFLFVWQGRGATPLQMAANNGHVEALRILLQALSKDFA
jgi:hypothetical protein